MKTIEELGISPWPWKLFGEHMVCYKNGMCVCNDEGDFHTVSDARLTAAAPDLYKCLYDAIIVICRMCPHCSVHQGYECNEPKRKCCANVWRKVLADAAGGKNRNE